MVKSVSDSLRFMETLAGVQAGEISRVDFFTSHEALLLPYEQAVTRQVPRREGWYNLGTHFPWIGLRTAEVDGAHADYFRGIRNPIGIKIGPSNGPGVAARTSRYPRPRRRTGANHGHSPHGARPGRRETAAPGRSGAEGRSPVLWCCDPMHGNTETTASGHKTRRFDYILSELEQSFDIHAELGSYQGGVHFELSGDNVTECIGGARGLTEVDLERAYESRVDPRLNYEQSLEMALLIGQKVERKNGGAG